MSDFITRYLDHTSGGETPNVYNRWSCIAGIGALLEKSVYVRHGANRIFPNVFVMLVGSAGARKSTAIKTMVRYIRNAGYKSIASDSATKEAFLHFLSDSSSMRSASAIANDPHEFLFGNMGELEDQTVTPMLIAADEFNNFFANNILEFLSMLGDLWDKDGDFTGIARTGNVEITNPIISMITGNTTETLCRTFPVDALGQGFFSRQLFIYGEPNGIKIAFPEPPCEKEVKEITDEFSKLALVHSGELKYSAEARNIAEQIYKTQVPHPDPRFVSYDNRRFTHLQKLMIIHAIADGCNEIQERHVIRANTVLTAAEFSMPKALGEYGNARNSKVMHKMAMLVDNATDALEYSQLLAMVRNDLERITDFIPLVETLAQSKRIVKSNCGRYLLPKRTKLNTSDDPYLDWSYITAEEKK